MAKIYVCVCVCGWGGACGWVCTMTISYLSFAIYSIYGYVKC
jgi:hypothetical protein